MDQIQITPAAPTYRRRRGSGFGRFLGSLIFFLLSLIPMCIVAWRIDLLSLGQQHSAPPAPTTTVVAERPAPKKPSVVVELPKPRKELEPVAPIERDPPPIIPAAVAPALPERPVQQIAPQRAADAKPSAIVPLTLDNPLIRVITKADSAADVLCDIGLSRELSQSASPNGYILQAEKLGHRDKRTVIFDAVSIPNATVGAEITVTHRNNNVVCEIEPKFVLPSGTVQQFTISRGAREMKQLARSISGANAANKALPDMRSELQRLEAAYRQAVRASTSQAGSNPADVALRQTQAKQAAARFFNAGRKLEKNIARAEAIVATLPTMTTDLNALKQIGEYGERIISVATISVRIYVGDQTLPAEIK